MVIFKCIVLFMLATISDLVSAGPAMGWGSLNSTAIDYETFNAILRLGTVPYIGPEGLYALTDDLGVVYVDMAPGGELAVKNPAWRDVLVSHLLKDPPGGLNFLDTIEHERLEVRTFAKCNEVCSSPGHVSVCNTCSCSFKERISGSEWSIVEIWTCQ
jgi:hypothetical protein